MWSDLQVIFEQQDTFFSNYSTQVLSKWSIQYSTYLLFAVHSMKRQPYVRYIQATSNATGRPSRADASQRGAATWMRHREKK